MRLYLKNIGMIKEADVKLDGLTVIAGENDTGKSTVGKMLFILARTFTFYKYGNKNKTPNQILNWLIKQIFKDKIIKKNSFCYLKDKYFFVECFKIDVKNRKFLDAIFIETPFVLNMFDTFKTIQPFISSQNPLDIYINYPYVAWDLYLKSYNKSQFNPDLKKEDLLEFTKNTTKGFWIFDDDKKEWRFKKENRNFQINNVAMGIKQFGIIEILLKNGYISKNRILIIDEPEVHLHPKWQIEYAKLIVELVKKGIKVLITSHSPFFIEAIENLYEDTKFYLAKDGMIKENKASEIYKLLSESIDELEKMEIEKLKW